MNNASVAGLATVTASTKRTPTRTTGGLSAVPATSIVSLKCHPLTAVNAETQMRYGLNKPFITWQTFVADDTGVWQLILQEML